MAKKPLTGGRNIGDEYFDLREDFNFLDQDIWISGPIVSLCSKYFNEFWNSNISTKVKRNKSTSNYRCNL